MMMKRQQQLPCQQVPGSSQGTKVQGKLSLGVREARRSASERARKASAVTLATTAAAGGLETVGRELQVRLRGCRPERGD